MSEMTYQFPKANPRHRLAAALLDGLLAMVTLYIGWASWSLIAWSKGQTPGKQVLKIRVYDKTTGRPVRWGHMLIRQYLIISSIPLFLFIFFYAVGAIHYWSGVSDTLGLYYFNGNMGPWFAAYGMPTGTLTFKSYAFYILVIGYLFPIVDALWIFRGGQRNRLVDVIAKTDVINEAGGQSSEAFAYTTPSVSASYTAQSPYSTPTPPTESRVTREIREATELFQNGHISEAEYAALKKKIIAGD